MPEKKIVLAYSGGLDTSVAVPWLKDKYDAEIVTLTVDLGMVDLESLRQRALGVGAAKAVTVDGRETLVNEFLFPALKAGAIYEEQYPLATALGRPLIARYLAEAAEAEGAFAVAHGCTGKGNDQVRFELAYMALEPKLKIIAPWRLWDIASREDAIAYAHERNIPITATLEKIYSHDENIWHISHEGGPLEDPWNEMEDSLLQWVTPIAATPDEPAYVEISFEEGRPVALNDVRIGPVELLTELNRLGSEHGVGVVDIVENRIVGMKSRGIYETPGGTIITTAHRELESLTLDKESQHYKDIIAEKYANIVYNGQWFSPLRESLDAFVGAFEKHVSGTIRLKLFKGHCLIAGRRSIYSLYREDLATFGQEDVYDQSDAQGFINLFGLPGKVEALLSEVGVVKGSYRAPDYFKTFKRD
ncbi:MAG: argininosuccinate synthase [Candidatus Marinimicrobia bacterium]|nr:argininosuccinate synthase [Candidatus Neomarinimicrobiota bacterium]